MDNQQTQPQAPGSLSRGLKIVIILLVFCLCLYVTSEALLSLTVAGSVGVATLRSAGAA